MGMQEAEEEGVQIWICSLLRRYRAELAATLRMLVVRLRLVPVPLEGGHRLGTDLGHMPLVGLLVVG